MPKREILKKLNCHKKLVAIQSLNDDMRGWVDVGEKAIKTNISQEWSQRSIQNDANTDCNGF